MTTETPSHESKPESTLEAASDSSPITLRQRLMPQASIRSLIALIAVSAVVMWIARTMIVGDIFWAKCFGAVLATITACFVTYAALFLLAHLFTIATTPLFGEFDNRNKDGDTEVQDR